MPPASGSIGTLSWNQVDENSSTRASIDDFKGKVLVLDMYATWCAPCRDSIPHLIELQNRHSADGLEVVGLNVGGPDDRVKVRDFANDLKINYSLGFPDRALTDFLMFDDQSIPQTFIFNREGMLRKRIIGYRAEELEQAIQRELKASAAALNQGIQS
jgi:thiol-disulfide isomerase/thioredoxin